MGERPTITGGPHHLAPDNDPIPIRFELGRRELVSKWAQMQLTSISGDQMHRDLPIMRSRLPSEPRATVVKFDVLDPPSGAEGIRGLPPGSLLPILPSAR